MIIAGISINFVHSFSSQFEMKYKKLYYFQYLFYVIILYLKRKRRDRREREREREWREGKK